MSLFALTKFSVLPAVYVWVYSRVELDRTGQEMILNFFAPTSISMLNNLCIFIKISLQFIPEGSFDNKSLMV